MHTWAHMWSRSAGAAAGCIAMARGHHRAVARRSLSRPLHLFNLETVRCSADSNYRKGHTEGSPEHTGGLGARGTAGTAGLIMTLPITYRNSATMYLGHNAGEVLLHQVGHHVRVGQHLLLHALALSLLAEDARVLQPPLLPFSCPCVQGTANTVPCQVLRKSTSCCHDLQFCIALLAHTATNSSLFMMSWILPVRYILSSRSPSFKQGR